MDESGHLTPPAAALLRQKQSAAAEIATGLVQLMSRYTGRGPTRARTTLNTNLVVVVFEEALTPAERNLVAADQADAVASMRRTFKETMKGDAVELVESVLQRTVSSLLGDTDPFGNVAVQVFVLEPEPETGLAATAYSEIA